MTVRTRMVAACGALVATAVIAASFGVVTSAGPAQAGVPAAPVATVAHRDPVEWRTCSDKYLKSQHAQCGMLAVPLDPADPGGTKIKIAVDRVLHTSSPYRGVVFTNPGGPGGTGLDLAPYGQYVPDKVGLTYDWYGIDPRGVGASVPALTCDGGYFGYDRPEYKPHTPKILAFWKKKTAGYAKSCGRAEARELLPHLGTTDNVADYEALRKAIGVDQITYYGFSYGTYLGEVYATLHPGSIKAMVLDGVIDPHSVFYQSNLDQDAAFQVTIEKFFAWVARYDRTYHLGRTEQQVYRTYTDLHAKLVAHPADGKIGPDELDDALLPAGYYNLTWLTEAKALSDLVVHGRAGGIEDAYRGSNPVGKGSDNGYAVYLATECTDAPWPDDFATYQHANARESRKAPFEAWANGWYNQPCQSWPASDGARVKVSGTALHAPVLLAAEQYDAATPFPGALAARKLFPTSRLVEGVGGTSHAVTLYGVSCTDDTIAALLAHGTLPHRVKGDKADKRCPGLAPPDPTASPESRVGSPQASVLRPGRRAHRW